MKIYTKTGDAGDTSLYGGERRAKSDLRIAAYGDVDELQAALGLIVATLPEGNDDIRAYFRDIQNNLFILCAELARTETKKERNDPELREDDVTTLEQHIDTLEKDLRPLKAFIIQGGSPAGAETHLARAICRRAERSIVALHKKEPASPVLLRYINRLSDLLFVVARTLNHRAGVPEEEWHPKG